MAVTFRSFEELAKVFGKEVKKELFCKHPAWRRVLELCGKKALRIFDILNDREACKRYGPSGDIYLDLESIQAITGYDPGVIQGAAIALVRNGFARFSFNGQYLLAA
jgi:hypothetical protein